jgi:hypothetical protein
MTKRRMGKEDARQITGAQQAAFANAMYQLYWITKELTEDVDGELWQAMEMLFNQMTKSVPVSARAAADASKLHRSLTEQHRERIEQRIAHLRAHKAKSKDFYEKEKTAAAHLDKEIADLEKRIVGALLSSILEKAEDRSQTEPAPEMPQPTIDDVAADLLADMDLDLDWNGID